ncbi:MAG TPA: DinB family protein [Candidatus Acidoferrales bacterium]|nr:DinB family protein [Candidatus Acidoferrales bacterium]
MPMTYSFVAIPDAELPRAARPVFQHLVDTYASETNKVISVWRAFLPGDLDFRPHPRSMSVEEVFRHQLLSERRFFGEFLSRPELPPEQLLPAARTPESYAERLGELAAARLEFIAGREEAWWLEREPFFDVVRERIWIFWRRVLHTAHHRSELVVYLRLAGRAVPPVYGPSADFSWKGADPTTTPEAAGRS